METDILMQVGLILISVVMFLFMYNIPQKALTKLRSLHTTTASKSKRHFVRGAQLLSQAQSLSRSGASATAVSAIAKSAVEEADKAIAFDPKDAAAHILKALALDLLGFRTSALDSLDVALSPMAARSLSDEERGDALFKRAEVRLGLIVSQGGERVDSVIADLVESVKLRTDNAMAYCKLGECYEKKGLVEEAKKAYEEALRVEPKFTVAREAMDRLGST